MIIKLFTAILISFTFSSNYSFSEVKVLSAPIANVKNIKSAKASDINEFDLSVMGFFQKFSRKYFFIDFFLVVVSGNNLLKGGILIALYWWLWFKPDVNGMYQRRIGLMLGLWSGVIAIVIARLAVCSFPFRVRPFYNPNLRLTLPYKVTNAYLTNHSSFPSDHAVWFFALAIGLYLSNRRIGIIAFVVTLIVTVSRVYLCFHYPTDVIAGAAIGLVIGFICCSSKAMQKLSSKVCGFSEKKPQLFYTIFFISSYELVNLFADVNDLLSYFSHII